VATAQLLPIYTKISQKILRKNGAQRLKVESDRVLGGNQYIIEGLDRFWLALRCPSHAWSWPRANQEERVQGFDSHQTCHTQRWQVGPIYRLMARTDATAR
jgi:hypothetical protein